MAEPFKEAYNHHYLSILANDLHDVYSKFPVSDFLDSTIDSSWKDLGIKDRIYKITENLKIYLPADYGEALKIMGLVIGNYKMYWPAFFLTYIELYGLDDENWDLSIKTLEKFTCYASGEMAVRSFIVKDEKKMMAQMLTWSKHENEHVRRLSSEGCRPALPWAQALVSFKNDPSPILPILEQLKNDPSPYVCNSVANNLNDISKTHPDLVIEIAEKWYGKNDNTNWIVKHACRTLLKKGNPKALNLFGFSDNSAISISDFKVETPIVSWGEDLFFSFSISINSDTKVRLEYGIDFVKAKGKRSRKIFQISEINIKANTKKNYQKRHSFADVTTRKHYPGTHSLTLIVNGEEKGTLDFELVK